MLPLPGLLQRSGPTVARLYNVNQNAREVKNMKDGKGTRKERKKLPLPAILHNKSGLKVFALRERWSCSIQNRFDMQESDVSMGAMHDAQCVTTKRYGKG